MDKKELQQIFSSAYDESQWLRVLREVFGANRLFNSPRPISLPSNDRAEAAYELGSFTTAEGRIVGIYKVIIKPTVWLERNKVGLRELLRKVYQYDVDAALIVFEQGKNWRLSFVSEIKVLNDEGEVVKQATEPKRYTYLLGEGEKTLTPSIRLSKLAGKALALKDLLDAFSVEALNQEFYHIVADKFYQLIGGSYGKGRNTHDYQAILKLPSVNKDSRRTFQEFGVRLIGRAVFCWFLKEKKSVTQQALLPENLLSSQAVKQNPSYYHGILEPLFFQTLNTKMEERIEGLPEGTAQVPFLNGGLFEPDNDDFYKVDVGTGLSTNINTLIIPDEWFLAFFEELEKYNFTIDENSVADVEVSVDPEMLGRIFENLLAEIDPDSGETARKATGSFYTPREIVDYMATESLVQYLHTKTSLEPDLLRPVFNMAEGEQKGLSETDRSEVLRALDKVKILDPACGSGAFPMGVLQKIVTGLQKLDPEATWWTQQRINENTDATARKAVKEKLRGNPEYSRKIGIIQNSLYGVDIQPIAAEISKLRCFLTLIVDENIDDQKPNRGIEPLPNLEFKFVTADTLIRLPEETDFGGLFNANDDLDNLKQLRIEYLQSYGAEKEQIKQRFEQIRKRIEKEQLKLGKNVDTNSRAFKISTWKPFSHEKANWFDPEWMYGVKAFDIVIGNPPYVRIQNLPKENKEQYNRSFATATKNYDLYVLFDERGMELLNENGSLIYIQPNKFFNSDYGVGLRRHLTEKRWLHSIVDFQSDQMFSTATVYTCILHCVRSPQSQFKYVAFKGANKTRTFEQYALSHKTDNTEESYLSFEKYSEESWSFGSPIAREIFVKMEAKGDSLIDYCSTIFVGLQTSADPVYILEKREGGYYSKHLDQVVSIEDTFLKPLLKGAEIRRYYVNFQKLYILFPYRVEKNKATLIPEETFKKEAPKTWSYLTLCEDKLRGRESGKMNNDGWYAFGRNQNLTAFTQPKIMTQVLANKASMVYDFDEGYHFVGGGNAGGYGIVLKEDCGINYNYVLALLNSKLLDFYLKNHTSRFQNNYYSYAKRFIEKLPIIKSDESTQTVLSGLAGLVQSFYKEDAKYWDMEIPHKHIAETLEELIDIIVMEMYFQEEFIEQEIQILEWVKKIQNESMLDNVNTLEYVSRLYRGMNEHGEPLRTEIKNFQRAFKRINSAINHTRHVQNSKDQI